jgi:hypothetical protein
MDDAARPERLLRNLARRLELEAPGVSKKLKLFVHPQMDIAQSVHRIGNTFFYKDTSNLVNEIVS